MRHPAVAAAALVVLTGVTYAKPVLTQDSSEDLTRVFSVLMDVRVVNLEVVVTDEAGVAIHGLHSSDFRLLIDGKPIPIDFFAEIRDGMAAPQPTPGDESSPPAPLSVVPGDPVGVSYLVFIDEFFAIARDRDLVLRALIDDLPQLGDKDQMAIVGYDGRGIELLGDWTRSRSDLVQILESALERPTYGLHRYSEQRQFDFERLLQDVRPIRPGELDEGSFVSADLTPEERIGVERLTEQIQRSVNAAAATLRGLPEPLGRKVMLLFSGGWPFLPVDFVASSNSDAILYADTTQGASLFRPLSDTANLLGYTIYPVDVPGYNDFLSDAYARGEGADLIKASKPPKLAAKASSFRRQEGVHFTLEFLADETGGRAFINRGRLEALRETVVDARNYYWLGFTPARDWDNQRHKIAVEARKEGLLTRSRQSHLDSSREYEAFMTVESALLMGQAADSGSLEVEIGDPSPVDDDRVEVPVTIVIPFDEVTFMPEESGFVTRLEVRVALRDLEGRRAHFPTMPCVFKTDEYPTEGSTGRYQALLGLSSKAHEGVIAVHDLATGNQLATTIEITP